MRSLIGVLVCASIFATVLADLNNELMEKLIRAIEKAHVTCNADSATREDIEALVASSNEETGAPNFDAHIFCVSKTLGWQNADGSINEEDFRSKAVATFGDIPIVAFIVKRCIRPQATPEATAERIYECYISNLRLLAQPNQ